MGTMILAIAFVTEAAFAAYCIVTQSNQKRAKGLVRIGALVVFAILALVSVIEWGFRWYGLATLLLVWAALGAWALTGRKAEKKEFKAGRILLRGIAALLLVFIAVTPALIFPQYRLPKMTGKHPVATVQYTYTDASRPETFRDTGENRSVNVEFWYPQDSQNPTAAANPVDAEAKYPLVVFSHGAFGVKASNTSTFMELASNGYVVCSIDHPYHSMYTVGSDGRLIRSSPTFMQEVLDANNGKYNEEESFRLTLKWTALRTADINFLLDTIIAQTQDSGSGEVYAFIDTQKIGLMGHSLGGAASAQVARERVASGRNDIDAVINLDGDLLGEYLDYVDGQYVINDQIYPVPLLTIYSDDMMRLIEGITDPNEVVAARQITASAPDAYEITIPGTNHMSLTDLPLVSPLLVSLINNSVNIGGGEAGDKNEIIEQMNDTVLHFFNVTLKGEGSFSAAETE